jgi:hypothetical protein
VKENRPHATDGGLTFMGMRNCAVKLLVAAHCYSRLFDFRPRVDCLPWPLLVDCLILFSNSINSVGRFLSEGFDLTVCLLSALGLLRRRCRRSGPQTRVGCELAATLFCAFLRAVDVTLGGSGRLTVYFPALRGRPNGLKLAVIAQASTIPQAALSHRTLPLPGVSIELETFNFKSICPLR